MNDNSERKTGDAQDPLADLLKHGKPREPAPQAARARAYQQLHAHWCERTRRKRQRRKTISWAVAASTIFAVVIIVFNTVNNGGLTPTAVVAKVVRSSGGDVRLRTHRWSQPTVLSAADGLPASSTLTTGTASHLALAWHKGGSLRVNEKTEVRIVSPERISLVAGSIYFDSISNHGSASEPKSLSIETPYGVVTHLGTQFSTRLQDDGLTISVREGKVTIAGAKGRLLLSAGDEFEIDHTGLREQRHVEAFGEQWQWTQNIAPTLDSSNRSAYELLEWIARETGYTVHYDSDDIVTFARQGTLTGMEGLTPIHALKVLPYATDLQYDIVDGVINIRATNLPGRSRQTTPEGR